LNFNIIEDSRGRCVAIEVKASESVSSKDAEGVRFFKEAIKQRFLQSIILYRGQEIVPFGNFIKAIPASALWS
jgi:predicted AAA+ superfamily ATPase